MPQQRTVSQVMKQLEAHGDEKVRLRYERDGAGDNVFGVLMGKIRGLAQSLGTDHALGLALWATGNHEARILACMLLDPEALTEKEARALLEPLANAGLVDELVGRVLVHAPVAEALQTRWMAAPAELPRRAGWKLLAGRIARGSARDVDVPGTLARIERELPTAPYRVKEGINYCLVWIGLHLPAFRDEAIAIGERLGRWDPRPIPKGCTSSYAPEWIAAALALRNGEKTAARQAKEAGSATKGTGAKKAGSVTRGTGAREAGSTKGTGTREAGSTTKATAAREAGSTKKGTATKKATAAKKAGSATKKATAKEAGSTKKVGSATKKAAAKKAGSATKAAAAKKAGLTEKGTATKKAGSTMKGTAAKKAGSAKKGTATKKATTGRKAAPVDENGASKRAPAAKKAR